MDAVVGSVDGTTILRDHMEGVAADPEGLGRKMVERLLDLGAAEILAEIRRRLGRRRRRPSTPALET